MSQINIIIADDEAPARNRLSDLLGDIENANLVGAAKNGKEAIELAEAHSPDLLILDIRMPLMDGIEAAQHAQQLAKIPKIIFATAYDSYAINAFDLNAIDYLLKPIRLERLQAAINKVSALMPNQLENIKPLQDVRSHLSISERGKIILVPMHEVIYFRAEQKYTTVRTRDNEYLFEESLTQLETELADTFLRLHRNSLVSKAHISGFEKQDVSDSGGKDQQWVALLKEVSETIPVSRRQLHLIKSF